MIDRSTLRAGRVAIGDEIGELRAKMIVVLIGERPA
jgi:ethanolamine ammonia-lyase small subunit